MTESLQSGISKRIVDLRLAEGLNRKEASSAIGIPYTTYVDYEKGIYPPNSVNLCKIAAYYEVSLDYFAELIDDPNRPFDSSNGLSYEDLRFGYVVKFVDGKYGMVLESAGKKIAKIPRHASELSCGRYVNLADVLGTIVEVYGYADRDPLRCNSIGRPLLWQKKKPPVKMTMGEICKKLGYDVEIIKEESE